MPEFSACKLYQSLLVAGQYHGKDSIPYMVMFDRLELIEGVQGDKLVNHRSERCMCRCDILDEQVKEYENRISVH